MAFPAYASSAEDSGPYPHPQGMSPSVSTAILGHVAGEQGLGGSLQMPAGYGSTSLTRGPLANGVLSAPTAQGATLTDELRPGAADVSGGGSLETTEPIRLGRGTRETGPEGATSHEGVQGRVGAPYTSTTSQQAPLVHPAPADHQHPHTPAPRQPAAAQVSTPLAGGELRDDPSGSMQGPPTTTGTRLSMEAQRAMTQLASQRAALVQALQTRARGASGVGGSHGQAASSVPDVGHQEGSYDNGEEVVWYSRLQGFLRRRVMDPVWEQVETLRRGTPSEPLMSPTTRRAMQEWTERPSSLRPGPPPDMRATGLTEEDIQGEVRRQVQSVMTDRGLRTQS